MKAKSATIAVSISFAAIGAASVFLYLLSSPARASEQALFIIPPHTLLVKALSLLEDQGYIRNTKAFKLLLHIRKGTPFEPGGYLLSKNMNAWQVLGALNSPEQKWVSLPPGLTNEEIAETFAKKLAWNAKEQEIFRMTYAAMYWDYFNEDILDIFSQLFSWDQMETEKFSTMSAVFTAPRFDFFRGVYVPGDYLVGARESASHIVDKFLEKIVNMGTNKKSFLEENFNRTAAVAAQNFIRDQIERLPDLIPLPASELAIHREGSQILLTFDTTYWNEGAGPLELMADTQTKGIEGDVSRNIYQHIYRIDESTRNRLAGNFLWHDTHLHYHYADFINYSIERIGAQSNQPKKIQKSTFCIRDITKVDVTMEHASEKAVYTICGKERQGVSVGWGDTYFHTYPDQNIDVTNFEKGLYRLTFTVNPQHVFEELRSDNNVASVIIKIDPENLSVELIDEITSSEH